MDVWWLNAKETATDLELLSTRQAEQMNQPATAVNLQGTTTITPDHPVRHFNIWNNLPCVVLRFQGELKFSLHTGREGKNTDRDIHTHSFTLPSWTDGHWRRMGVEPVWRSGQEEDLRSGNRCVEHVLNEENCHPGRVLRHLRNQVDLLTAIGGVHKLGTRGRIHRVGHEESRLTRNHTRVVGMGTRAGSWRGWCRQLEWNRNIHRSNDKLSPLG
mmetsp:Transcript_26193/g.65840  ORF Transcript_26193/g.65840 Transcript_26193/m.65840 type:complete len:215 (+) Transcript_26193:2316-2960(+)